MVITLLATMSLTVSCNGRTMASCMQCIMIKLTLTYLRDKWLTHTVGKVERKNDCWKLFDFIVLRWDYSYANLGIK